MDTTLSESVLEYDVHLVAGGRRLPVILELSGDRSTGSQDGSACVRMLHVDGRVLHEIPAAAIASAAAGTPSGDDGGLVVMKLSTNEGERDLRIATLDASAADEIAAVVEFLAARSPQGSELDPASFVSQRDAHVRRSDDDRGGAQAGPAGPLDASHAAQDLRRLSDGRGSRLQADTRLDHATSGAPAGDGEHAREPSSGASVSGAAGPQEPLDEEPRHDPEVPTSRAEPSLADRPTNVMATGRGAAASGQGACVVRSMDLDLSPSNRRVNLRVRAELEGRMLPGAVHRADWAVQNESDPAVQVSATRANAAQGQRAQALSNQLVLVQQELQAMRDQKVQAEAAAKSAEQAIEDAAKLNAALGQANDRIHFMEKLNGALTDQLGRCAEVLRSQGADVPEAAASDRPVPSWVLDQRSLSPLLAAYEVQQREQQDALAEAANSLSSLRQHLESVSAENIQLRRELSERLQSLGKRAEQVATESVARPPHGSDLKERVDLLSRENDLLVEQQEELHEEIRRLQTAVERKAGTDVNAINAAAKVAGEARIAIAEAQSLRERLQKSTRETEMWSNRAAVARREADQAQAERDALKAQAASAAHLAGRLESVTAECRALRDQAAFSGSAARQITNEADNAAQELTQLRSANKTLRLEVGQLTSKIEGLRSQFRAATERETDLVLKSKQIQEEADVHKMSAEANAENAAALKEEMEALLTHLATARAQARLDVEAQLLPRAEEAEKTCVLLQDEVQTLRAEVVRLESAVARKDRDVQGARAECTALQQKLGAVQHSPQATSSATKQLQAELISAREELHECQKALEVAERSHRQQVRGWDRERAVLESSISQGRAAAAQAEKAAEEHHQELRSVQNRLERLLRDHRELTDAKRSDHARLQGQIEALTIERDAERIAAGKRIDELQGMWSRASAEAEQMLQAKEAVLERWRDEALKNVEKLEGASEHARDRAQQDSQARNRLRQEIASLQAKQRALESDLRAARADAAAMAPRLAHMEARLAVCEREKDEAAEEVLRLQSNRRELLGQVDRLTLERAKLERRVESLASQKHSLQRRVSALQSASNASNLPSQSFGAKPVPGSSTKHIDTR